MIARKSPRRGTRGPAGAADAPGRGEPPLLRSHGFALTALTLPANLAGLPALSRPVPGRGGVIASMQVIGHAEEHVRAFGRVVEAALRR